MSSASMLIVVGALAMVMPFSGLPGALRTAILIVLGGVVVAIGVALRSREQRHLVALQSAGAAPEQQEHAEPPNAPSPI